MNDSSLINHNKTHAKSFSENWEVEDPYFPEIINTFDVNPSKNFSRNRELNNELVISPFNQENEPIPNHSPRSIEIESLQSQSNFNSEAWKRKRRNNIIETSSKLLSVQIDAQASKESMNQSEIEMIKSKIPKRKPMFLGKLFLVKKFIKKLQESTFFRSPKWLKSLHYEIINDWSYFLTKSHQKDTSLTFLSKITKIKPLFNFLKMAVVNLMKIFIILSKKFHGFIIYPSNFFRLFWDCFMFIITLHNFIVIPLNVGFAIDFFQEETIFSQFNSIYIFLIDVFLNLNTAYYSRGELIESRLSIISNYIAKGSFLRDVLSLSFLILTQFLDSSEISLIKFSALFFLLRVRNLSKAVKRFEEFFFSDEKTDNIISFIRLIFVILLFSHWCACFYILIGKSENPEGWMIAYGVKNSNMITQYVSSLYFIVVVMNTVGFGDMVATTINEKMFTICFIMIASIVFAYTINQIGTILYNISKGERELKRTMNLINGYMKANNINFDLKIKIRNYLEYLWHSNKNRNFNETQEIINKLSKNLKDELLLNANGIILKNIPFLTENFSEETLRKIVYEMKEVNLTPGDIIYSQEGIFDFNDQSLNFYIIRDGEIGLFLETPRTSLEKPKCVKIIRKGGYFGEFSCFSGFPRQTTATSLSFSSLFAMSVNTFIKILKENPEDYEKYCFIKDKMNISNDFSKIHRKCFSCEQSNHTEMYCPKIHLILSKERVLQKYNYSIPQNRRKFERRKKKNIFNALGDLRQIDKELSHILRSKFKSEFSTFENEESLAYLESENSEKEQSPVLQEDSNKKLQSNDRLNIENKKSDDALMISTEKKIITYNNLNSFNKGETNQKVEFDQVKSYDLYFSNGNIENIISKIVSFISSKKSRKNLGFESMKQVKTRKSIFSNTNQFQLGNKNQKTHLSIKKINKKESFKFNDIPKSVIITDGFINEKKVLKAKINLLKIIMDCFSSIKKWFKQN